MYNSQIGKWNGIDENAENYYAQSPFNYVGDNPVKRVDLDGRDWGDKLMGFAVAVVDNATGLDYRGSYTPEDASDYNLGQDAGDATSVVAGSIDAEIGGRMASGSAVLTIE